MAMLEAELVVIGAGVAGLAAATVAAQHGLDVLVIERMGAGGQVMNVEQVRNMPGFVQAVSGFELGPQLQEQAEAAGARFTLDTVVRLSTEPDGRHRVHCEGETVVARAVLVAAGSARRTLDVPGAQALAGRGVSHCASCDGPLFRGQPVCVVGGGDSAISEALVLAGHASRVSVVFREARPHAQQQLLKELEGQAHVEMLPGAEVVGIEGEQGVSGVLLQRADGSRQRLDVEGVFVFAGLQPETAFLGGALPLDGHGRIETDAALATAVPGVFAAGDIRAGAAYLLASAAGEGAAAALSAYRYLRP